MGPVSDLKSYHGMLSQSWSSRGADSSNEGGLIAEAGVVAELIRVARQVNRPKFSIFLHALIH